MSVFFNGRLLITPASASVVDDSALRNPGLTVGNLPAFIGPATGGQPNTALRFGSPSEAIKVLKSGDLLSAVIRAFDPSAQTGGPSTVVAIRVNPAVQASGTIKDSSGNVVIDLLATDYGLDGNRVTVKVETGTNAGTKKLTTQYGTSYYTGDNIGRNLFTIRYGGAAASATMTITGTQLTIDAPTGTNVVTADLNVYNTIQRLVDYLNGQTNMTAAVLNGFGSLSTLNQLDYASAQDIKTATFTVTGNLQACIDWFNSNSEGLVDATRHAAAGTAPVNSVRFLTGGGEGTTTSTDWSNAFTTLQSQDVQMVVPCSSDAAIHAMADAHCAYMSTVGKMERRAICGMATGTTDAAAIAAAYALNSDRTSLVHVGMYDYNLAGVLTLFPPYILAAMIAGGFTGSNPGTAMTNKTLKIRGLERAVRNPTDTDVLIEAGIMCVEATNGGYKVVKSISTWLVNDNFNRVEVSTGVALDFVTRNVRDALDVLRGEKGSPLLLSRAVSIADSTLRELARAEPAGPGVIVGDANSPAYKNIRATLEGDVVRVEFQCSPAIPANYVLTTVYAVPYSGSATVAA